MEKNKDEIIEEILADTLVYTRIFNRKLVHLADKDFMKTFFWLVLIQQYTNPSISGLGEKLNVSKSQMTSKVDQLAQDGFIKRVPDKKDRRIIRIVLTQEGQDYIKTSKKNFNTSMNQLLASLSMEEVEELKKSIKTIKHVVLKIQDGQDNV